MVQMPTPKNRSLTYSDSVKMWRTFTQMQRQNKASKEPKPRGKASSSDILGTQPLGAKVPSKWAAHHAELVELRDHLSGQRRERAASAEAEPAVAGLHIADAATDSYDRDWALALASSDQSVLYEVTEALKRIADGTYGICEITGEPIEADRLKALPWTRFCAAAQTDLEARGATSRTRLGQLGSYDSAPGDASPADENELEGASEERQAA
jgi:RNA polymerase-binding transcription factor DksA